MFISPIRRQTTASLLSLLRPRRGQHSIGSIGSMYSLGILHLSQPTNKPLSIIPQKRTFHSRSQQLKQYRFDRPPRFNRGPPTTAGFYWHLVPDSMKALFAIMGVSAFVLFVAGPVLIIVVPPLILGSYIMSKVWRRRREHDMRQRWRNLLETHLTYNGSILDQQRLERFALNRVIDAIRQDEQGITKILGIKTKGDQYHPFETRFELSELESIDQDFKVSRSYGIREQITVISFGLLDTESSERFPRVATVVLTLKPKTVTDLLDVNGDSQDVIIEVRPTLPFKTPVILTTESGFEEPPVINIRTRR